MTHQLSKSCLRARHRLGAGLVNDMQYIEDKMIAQSSMYAHALSIYLLASNIASTLLSFTSSAWLRAAF